MIQTKHKKLVSFAFFAVLFCVWPTFYLAKANASSRLPPTFVIEHFGSDKPLSQIEMSLTKKNARKFAALSNNSARRLLKNSKTKIFICATLVSELFVRYVKSFQKLELARRLNQSYSIDLSHLSSGRAPPKTV